MNTLSMNIILVSLLGFQGFHSIDGSVAQIYETLKQEVEELIDSQDYESVDEMLKDSKVKVKYFDYYVPTTPKPTTLPTTKGAGQAKGVIGDSAAAAQEKTKADDAAAGGSSPMVYVIALVVVVIVVIGAVGGIFFYVRTKGDKNKNIKKKVKRSCSRESLASIETVASDTGKPLKSKAGPKAAPKKK